MCNNTNHNKVEFISSDIDEIREIIDKHIESLSYPMDSCLEERLLEAGIYKIILNSRCIGYEAVLRVKKSCRLEPEPSGRIGFIEKGKILYQIPDKFS